MANYLGNPYLVGPQKKYVGNAYVGGSTQAWPATAAALSVAMGGGTWASIWPCDDQSSNSSLTDTVGTVNLSATGTPLFRLPGAFPGDFAAGGDSAGDDFTGLDSANYNIGLTGQLAFYACLKLGAKQDDYLFGKSGGSPPGYLFHTLVSGFITFEIFDGTNTFVATVSADHFTGQFVDVLAIIDRDSANVLKLATSLGTATNVSLTTALTIANTGTVRLGVAGVTNNPSYAYAAVANAGVAALSPATMIASIRAATGRS